MLNMKKELFELVRQLGTGGFAHTYQAKVLSEELIEEYHGLENVAIKIPLSSKERSIKRDIETNISVHQQLRGLSSANLVKYLGFEMFDGKFVMVMEYMPDGSLRDKLGKLDRQKAFPLKEAVFLTREILKGLSAIHKIKVFHRDIKPENILLDGKIPKIADFGISRMLSTNELASTTTGTLFYMSPEILSPKGASFPSDIWSLGVAFYEMVTGKLPFGNAATDPGTMIDLIRQSVHIPACVAKSDVPIQWSKLIDKALCKEVEGRFKSADEMMAAMDRLLSEPPELEARIGEIRKLFNTGSARKAVEEKLLELAREYPNSLKLYLCWGEYYNGCFLHKQALDAFKKGLEIHPEDAELHFDAALALEKLNEKGDALRAFEKAIGFGLDGNKKRYALNQLKMQKK